MGILRQETELNLHKAVLVLEGERMSNGPMSQCSPDATYGQKKTAPEGHSRHGRSRFYILKTMTRGWDGW